MAVRFNVDGAEAKDARCWGWRACPLRNPAENAAILRQRGHKRHSATNGSGRSAGFFEASGPKPEEEMPKPEDNEVVMFRDMFYAGLPFPLDPVVVGILKHLKISLHQLTQNAFIRLSPYMWICKTMKVTSSPEGFAFVHRVHKQPRVITGTSCSSGVEVKREGQFGCLTFVFKVDVLARSWY